MDRQRFLEAVAGAEVRDSGVGTLNESALHAALKLYYEPRRDRHEIPLEGYVADVFNEGGCIEIQTRNYYSLRPKLQRLLDKYPVTLVYPIAGLKWVSWIDKATGEVGPRRKSPKRAKPIEVFFELYWIKDLLTHQNLRLRVAVLELEEYKYLDGWGKDRKRNASRATRVPIDLLDEYQVDEASQLTSLLPELPRQFTSGDLRKYGGVSPTGAQRTVSVLNHVGALERVGKAGRMNLYEIII